MFARPVRSAVITAGLAIITAIQPVTALPPGDTGNVFDNFTVTTLEGKPFDAGQLKGRIVLIDFWAVWCAPCIAAFPKLDRLHRDLAEEDFQVIGVAVYSGSREDVKEFLEDHSVTYPMVMGNEDLVEEFGVIGFPSYFLVGPDGTVVRHYVGSVPDLYQQVATDFKLLRSGLLPLQGDL